jgi:hypothetical protein
MSHTTEVIGDKIALDTLELNVQDEKDRKIIAEWDKEVNSSNVIVDKRLGEVAMLEGAGLEGLPDGTTATQSAVLHELAQGHERSDVPVH